MRTFPGITGAAALFLLILGGCGPSRPTGVVFGEREIRVGEREITVEVAITPAQLEQGLKYRRSLPKDRGMLFIFSRPTAGGFWMKDTVIPLSIAFIDGEGLIVDIQDMETDDGARSYSPPRRYLYALEMNRGWFEINNIRPGDRVEIGRGESRR
ncbi:MAG: DUF192 domain-containing protein [Candidatus Erginobacter occultus]|nr:DUF192 domain-containing protein [Candidatus Erginobacter occultus]